MKKLPPRGSNRRNIRPRSLSESAGEVPLKLSDDVKLSQDKKGRAKISWPRTGPLTLQLYPSRYIESTSVMHVNFLVHYLGEILKPGFKRNVICICDGGPDWSVKG